ncbi:beta-galactosidase [Fimbriimonas ginsengisoli]|uniref:Hydrolase, putative n=1 Tax=Fimbriimonas ginsengisoli Gsoil 348 TaxID=661478 RepID=A0A068NPB7_FIMGI|nr:beta-galactosidase [Fimbriimonas ginsengisoli]AIE85408.1 hydrolase, putative [Fimbriimonas ginsengisoli Gsoil 348]
MTPLLLLVALGSVQASKVNSFDTFDEVRQVTTLEAQVTTVPGPDGSQALQATFQPTEWPHVMLAPAQPWDWSAAGGIAIEVTNPGKETVPFGIRVDDDPKADGWLHSRTGNGAIAPGKTETFVVMFGPDPMSVGMRGMPPTPGLTGLGTNGGGTFDSSHVAALQLFLHRPARATTLVLDNIRTVPRVSLERIVDRFGQYARGDWPGKVHQDAELPARAKAELASYSAVADRDRFGGWKTGPKLRPTGFFRTERVRGKWSLVDPDGGLFFSFGIDTMGQGESTFVTGRDAMFTWLPSPADPLSRFRTSQGGAHMGPIKSGEAYNFYQANLLRKYGENFSEAWRETALRRLPAWGFNTIGNWSDDRFMKNGTVPYVATAGVYGDHARIASGSDYWGKMHDPFDPHFVEDVTRGLVGVAAKVKGDPWCVGYFVDNELSWAGSGSDGRYGLALGALSAPKGSPAKAAFIQQLRAKYSDIGRLNQEWKTTFPDWAALDLPIEFQSLTDIQRTDLSKFVHTLALRYFTVVRDELRKLDPDHLYLGCRFAWSAPEAEEAAAEVCDVVSFNIYAPKLGPEWDRVKQFDKPCIIGEFHFGALDRGMFHPGLVATPSQAARAAMYEEYVKSVLKNPAFVGCHWFQYIDEPLTGRWFDGENYNIGLVDVTDTPYPEITSAARRIHSQSYVLRWGRPMAKPAAPKPRWKRHKRRLRGRRKVPPVLRKPMLQ